MAKEIIVVDKVFKTGTLFVVNCGQKEFIRRAAKHGIKIKLEDELVSGTMRRAGNKFFRIVWIERCSLRNISTLVHEVFHLVIRICEDKGIPILANIEDGRVGDETAAYLMDFYMVTLTKKLWG